MASSWVGRALGFVARIAAVAADALLAVLVGLSRIYVRAHYASDVLAGEALAVAMYALAALVAVVRQGRRVSVTDGGTIALLPTGAT
jgi:undecaprenyl-diphosphatase